MQTVLERRRSELEEQENGTDALGAIDEEAAVMSSSMVKSKSALDESKQNDDDEMKTTSSGDLIEPSRGSKSERSE